MQGEERLLTAAAEAETPLLLLDLDIVEARFKALRAILPEARVLYAVKANPHPDILSRLSGLGCGFDIASLGELDSCRAAGAEASRLSYGNVAKKETHIATAASQGVELFVVDSPLELDKVARSAPGSRIFCRLAVSGAGAEWPLTHKFGCTADMAIELLVDAKRKGLRPAGLSFHVGSQQTQPEAWTHALHRAGEVARHAARLGISIDFVNLGGGFPAHYVTPVPSVEVYAETIRKAVNLIFGSSAPELLIEPGRYMVGDAGALVTEVVLVADRPHERVRRWVYLDAGVWTGLDETMKERIHYRLHLFGPERARGPVVLAGPTCDSADVLYRHDVTMPLDLAPGEKIVFLSAGAYSSTCSCVSFNGFPPLAARCL